MCLSLLFLKEFSDPAVMTSKLKKSARPVLLILVILQEKKQAKVLVCMFFKKKKIFFVLMEASGWVMTHIARRGEAVCYHCSTQVLSSLYMYSRRGQNKHYLLFF